MHVHVHVHGTYVLCKNAYTMVVKFDYAIGGLINLPIDKISTQTYFYVYISRTELTSCSDTSFSHLHVIHVSHYMTCTPAHGISRLHNLGVGHYNMIYMSLGLRPLSCKSCSNLHLGM